ncbi:hypothetical protein PAXINDRAFT_14816 [Paxillus involutus ATCC 200175]|uniref:Uncharacterized protein n=1 Tax=Paxillus involutus ATCC 200175 TaxID=664439 RepID=A0A0C9TP65_PAXIN|nr:hypothetical protein PAXINDRAFT_14816 [Paxillus involutus ATCC 200175]
MPTTYLPTCLPPKPLRLVGVVVAQLLILIFASTKDLDDRGHPDRYRPFIGIYFSFWLLGQGSDEIFAAKAKDVSPSQRRRCPRPGFTYIYVGRQGLQLDSQMELLGKHRLTRRLFPELRQDDRWTTLLAPTLVSCYYDVQGTELNMTSPAFSHLLGIELDAYSPSMIHDASFPIIDVGGPVSGIAAAGVSFGMPGIINFNEAKYNLSTGGLLAAIRNFAGSHIPPGSGGTRLNFSGGTTIANARPTHGSSGSIRDWFGVQRNFSMYQQGITADINCYAAATSSQVLNFTNVNTTIPVTLPGNASLPYSLVVWSSTATCNTSSTATQQYVTWANASGQPDPAATGFLPTVVCPGHRNASDVYSSFVIATQGFYKYDFLPSTICEVTPLVTTTRVDYTDGGIINASQIISTQSFSPNDTYFLFYLAGVTNYHARNSQGLMNNIIGDTLYSTYSAAYMTPISDNTTAVYRELEDYWRGVIEFTATFLRAGYSAEGAFRGGIPNNMTSPINGTMTMLTIGWANRGPIYMFSVLPIAIVTVLTVIAAIYSFPHSCKEQHLPHQQTSFDQYVTWANASGQPDPAATGFLPTVVCPGHRNASDVYSSFVIATQGFYKYDFLPSTICEVTPLVTTTRVDYTDGGIINASQIISTQSFSPNDTYFLFYLAGVTNYHARNSQGLMNNIIGDTLYSTYSAAYMTPISDNTTAVYRELEDYWRGVIEFTATFLRAGYSAEGAFRGGIPNNMTSPINGTMTMLTIGWANRGPIYMFSVLPIAIVTVLTVIAAIYSFPHSCKEQHLPHQQTSFDQTSFDVSNTLQLIMACSGGGLTKASSDGDLTSKLSGFDTQGLICNENVKVKLEEDGNTKKLVVSK